MSNIYDEYFYKIYNWALGKTRNKEDAEDITSSVFTAIYEYLNKNIKVEKMENLIWKVAHNIWSRKAKEYILNKNNECLDDYDASEEINVIDKIIYKEIINNLESYNLTEKEKNAFNMYYLKDLSINDIATKLDSSCSNIKYYLYNARRKIKEKYDD